MPVAGHGKLRFGRPGFFSIVRRRKTTNLIFNEIHVTTETIFISKHSAILTRTVISKHSAILARNILQFWQGEEIDGRLHILEGIYSLCIESQAAQAY